MKKPIILSLLIFSFTFQNNIKPIELSNIPASPFSYAIENGNNIIKNGIWLTKNLLEKTKNKHLLATAILAPWPSIGKSLSHLYYAGKYLIKDNNISQSAKEFKRSLWPTLTSFLGTNSLLKYGMYTPSNFSLDSIIWTPLCYSSYFNNMSNNINMLEKIASKVKNIIPSTFQKSLKTSEKKETEKEIQKNTIETNHIAEIAHIDEATKKATLNTKKETIETLSLFSLPSKTLNTASSIVKFPFQRTIKTFTNIKHMGQALWNKEWKVAAKKLGFASLNAFLAFVSAYAMIYGADKALLLLANKGLMPSTFLGYKAGSINLIPTKINTCASNFYGNLTKFCKNLYPAQLLKNKVTLTKPDPTYLCKYLKENGTEKFMGELSSDFYRLKIKSLEILKGIKDKGIFQIQNSETIIKNVAKEATEATKLAKYMLNGDCSENVKVVTGIAQDLGLLP
ncbi:hypothetical protein KAT08_02995 [Candidatus Babeliales bacterium]|nr:hypothetical protein [Candidatus Babeliales bacterium]